MCYQILQRQSVRHCAGFAVDLNAQRLRGTSLTRMNNAACFS
jgi:hypothetical protein